MGIKGEFELYTEKEAFFNCAFLAALAKGSSIIHEVRAAPEFFAFADYLRGLGASVHIKNEQWEITGTNFKYEKPLNLDWLGNDFPYQKRNKKIVESLLAGTPFNCEEKIAVKDSLIRELSTFAVEVEWKLEGPDESDELARRMAKMQGIKNERKWVSKIPPVHSLLARDRYIAGDATEAAFFALAASLIPNSDITIKMVNLDTSRAGIFGAFKRLGADIEIITRHERGNNVWGDLRVKSTKTLIGRRTGTDILSTCLDEIPLLALIACFAEGETIFKLPIWALDFYKPILEAIYENFKIAGIDSGLYEEGFIVRGKGEIEGDGFDCKNIPALGLALHILNRKAKGKNEVLGIECVENVYPGVLKKLRMEN
jgi:5-enolpyruvylshikimate-3-phosphate synthase